MAYIRFRLSDHSLMIEKGHHFKRKIPRKHQYHPFYHNSRIQIPLVDLYCIYQNTVPASLWNSSSRSYLPRQHDKFIFMMSEENIQLTEIKALNIKN